MSDTHQGRASNQRKKQKPRVNNITADEIGSQNRESETVLLALSQSLQWEQIREHARWRSQEIEQRRYFAICLDADNHLFLAYWLQQTGPERSEQSAVPYSSLAVAKLACERHHATGKWEG